MNPSAIIKLEIVLVLFTALAIIAFFITLIPSKHVHSYYDWTEFHLGEEPVYDKLGRAILIRTCYDCGKYESSVVE